MWWLASLSAPKKPRSGRRDRKRHISGRAPRCTGWDPHHEVAQGAGSTDHILLDWRRRRELRKSKSENAEGAEVTGVSSEKAEQLQKNIYLYNGSRAT
jgi:hypothetical protein